MNEIYKLVGKLIQTFQELEEHLALLVYCHYYGKQGEKYDYIRKIALEQYAEIDGATFGRKLSKIINVGIMSKEESDYIVLDYFRDKRNYIVHNFFVENNFEEQSDIDKNIKELNKFLQEAQLVEKAYERMLLSDLQRLNIIKSL